MTRPLTLAESASAHAADRGSSLAVVDGLIRWSWSELDARADAVASGLRFDGVVTGDRVALLVRPSALAIAALYGIARAGAVVAPVGRGLTAAELAAAVSALDAQLVLHDDDRTAEAAAFGRPMRALGDPLIPSDPTRSVLPASNRDESAPGESAPDESGPGAVVLTSGTTGRPRAVDLSGTALRVSAEAWLAVLPPVTGWLLAVGLGHVAGLGVVWRAALDGVPLVIADPTNADAILKALASDPWPGHVSLVPTQLVRLLDRADAAGMVPPVTVRAIPLGGGPIPPSLVERALSGGWPIVPTYGLSEAGSAVTALTTAEAASHPDSAGRPLPGVSIRIEAPDADGIGEILVLTPARFTGYLNQPDETARMLTPDGWLCTGDLGSVDRDGRLTIADRRTDLIVRGGENIAPGEVEAVLRRHPAIEDAAVVARTDTTWGQVPVAAIVILPGAADPGDDVLVAHARGSLATAKVPVAFIRMTGLPRTASGKLRRAVVRARMTELGSKPSFEHSTRVRRPDGVFIAFQQVGLGPVPLLLLHGTLSTSRQLNGLARALADSGELTVISVDRRGSGLSRLEDPGPVDVATHVEDLAAVLDALGLNEAVIVGISFGGVVALEAAARLPDRILAVIAYEPPYGPVADAITQRAFKRVSDDTAAAFKTAGRPAAAEAFLRGVGGERSWEGLSDRSRTALAREGAGAVVDSALLGLDPVGLERIHSPVTIVTGDASEPVYRPIAESLVARIPRARHVRLPGARHVSPITDPHPFAAVVASVRDQEIRP